MQDFKNIHKKKRRRHGRRKGEEARNAFKAVLETPPPRKNRLKIVLPVLALALASYPLFGLLNSARTAKTTTAPHTTSSPAAVLTKADNWSSFKLAAEVFPSAKQEANEFAAPLPQGGKIVYAINERLQSRVAKVMQDFKVPYAALVAIEPKTGKILAVVSHSTAQPAWEKDACYRLYPMASLFKIVTASAALEDKKVTADTPFAFNGRLTSESPKHWRSTGRRSPQMPLAQAMGKSVNPVFGRLAGDIVGRDALISCAQKYGFNQEIYPGCPVIPSTAPPPDSLDQLMLTGAGLNHDVKVSPLHAASLMAAVANGGVMMAPSLAQQVVDAKGGTLFKQQPFELRRVVTPQTASELARMLSTTTVTGTSRKAFHDRRGRPMLASLKVAAKTGSIDGTDPAGHYSWFTAYAPMEDPQIAIAALVINEAKWKIKAPFLGEQALEAFFK
ncbi:penicillin-binding protein [Geomonas sp. RF6]|uniref:penicillin-binding transpeptidase domain-containing protein n=1 Tax=Geomonas sp. RF6 TaxID=2897342 RepID=UPI001E59F8DD|nr:penicillin-binding transpeptidase domain-containing protein [Geomonas sp. RF6]UFS71608.1 penicillin-binding protein [Geomonas sp. RF6]